MFGIACGMRSLQLQLGLVVRASKDRKHKVFITKRMVLDGSVGFELNDYFPSSRQILH